MGRFFLVLAAFCATICFCEERMETTKDDYRQFLIRLGFEDFSKKIQNNIKQAVKSGTAPGIGPASPKILETSKASYQILNYARELAVDVIGELERSNHSPHMKTKALQLTARLLSLQPLAGPKEFPARVLTGPADQIDEAQIDFIKAETERRMESQALTIAADLAYVLIGAEKLAGIKKAAQEGQDLTVDQKQDVIRLKRINDYTRVLTNTLYRDTVIGQTRHAGRALAAVLIKYAREQDPALEGRLIEAVENEGLHLRNFVGTMLAVPNERGELVDVEVRNGDFLMERSAGREAAAISSGVRPHPRNWWRAIKHGLVGYVVDLLFPVDKLDRSSLSLMERGRAELAQYRVFNHGISHAGIAEVKRDEKTGISMAWANDVYPDLGEGKIRMRIGILDQFALPGPYMRLGVARYNPQLLWEHVQEQIKKKGFPPYAFRAIEEEIDESGHVRIKPGGENRDYLNTISKSDFYQLHRKPEGFEGWTADQKKAFYERYYEKFMELTVAEIRRMMVEEGIGFAMEYAPGYGRLYCTQTVWMAAKRATGIDLQKFPDFWNPLAHVVKALGLEGSELIRTDTRILHPAGFAWQPMADHVQVVTYPPIPNDKRPEMTTMDSAVPLDGGVRRLVRVLDALLPHVGYEPATLDRKFVQAVVAGIGANTGGKSKVSFLNQVSVGTPSNHLVYRGNCNVLISRLVAGRPGVLQAKSEE